jgi:hypothetical protein
MKIGSYTIKQATRLESSGATFVKHGTALLICRFGEKGFELELLDVPGFKSVRREPVEGVATVTRAGEEEMLLMLPAEPSPEGAKTSPQSFELRNVDDFRVVTTFIEDQPGEVAASPDGKLIAVATKLAM